MNGSRSAPLGMLLAALALAACAEPAPPPPPPPPPPAPEPAPPPPPPACEALDEGCKADSATRARIAHLAYVFVPPEGWTYAMLEEATVAQIGDRGAVLVLTSFERGANAMADADKRAALVTSLSELVLLQPPKVGKLFKPDQKAEIAGIPMWLWERKGAKRGEDAGALLIVSAPLDQRELFGLGFAAKDDAAGTEAILAALKTIEQSEPPAKTEEEKKADTKEGG